MANDLPTEPAPQPPDLTFNLRSVSISTPSPYHENPISLKKVVGHFNFLYSGRTQDEFRSGKDEKWQAEQRKVFYLG